MAYFHVLCFLLTTIIFFTIASSQDNCTTQYCGTKNGVGIRFPFRLKGGQFDRCGYPKFALSCKRNTSSPTLNLPYSGEFVVESISYAAQTISLNDPANCLPRRLMSLNLSDSSPFEPLNSLSYTFYNCSGNSEANNFPIIECLSGNNYSVLAIPSAAYAFFSVRLSSTCTVLSETQVPVDTSSGYVSWQLPEELTLTWNEPDCSSCEVEGGTCGFKSSTGLEIQCTNIPSRGFSRSAKYGIGLGVGIPGLAGLIGICCYACCRIKRHRRQQSDRGGVDFPTIIAQHHPRMAIMGLDKPTIESYPMTILGESCRLPKANDGTCPICLSEYQSKDTLRTIPECNHYYHAQCIDEWLKLNATCPLCRNTPDASSVQSPSSTASLASSTLTSASASP